MRDPHYPSVDISFIVENVIASGKLVANGATRIGGTTAFILNGPQAIYKRTILIRELEEGQVCFEQATGLAFRFSFMKALLQWLEENREWKEGAYIAPNVNVQNL